MLDIEVEVLDAPNITSSVPLERVSRGHPDLALFTSDGHRVGRVCLLFPASDRGTHKFIRALCKPRGWLSFTDLDQVDEFNVTDRELAVMLRAESTSRAQAVVMRMSGGVNGIQQAVARCLTQRMFDIEHLPAVVAHCQGREDHYLSQNQFQGWQRNSGSVKQLTSCWVDLDYYKLVDRSIMRQLENDAGARELILTVCQTAGLLGQWFIPAQIVRSGRGLYVKWVFNKFLPGAAAPRWSLCETKLVELFKHLGADPAAIDSARVLRVVGSLNSKNLAPVRQIYSNDPCSFDDLASALLPRKRLSQIDREAVKTLRENYKSDVEGREKNGESTSRSTSKKQWLGTGQTWCSILCDELLWLVKERSKTGARGSMELCTFMYMTYRLLDGKIENETDFDRQVFELGEIMGANQKQLLGQVKNLFRNHAKGAAVRYYKKLTIIQKLSITDAELLGMPRLGRRSKPAFIEVKRRRADLPDFHQKARILERAGLSINMIAEQLSVTRVTAKRWLSRSV